MKRLMIILLSAISLISYSATASPILHEQVKTEIHDVGWQANPVSIEISFEAQTATFDLFALPASIVRYERKKFMSHNRKLNRYNMQRYGHEKTYEREPGAEFIKEPLPSEPEYLPPVFLEIAAKDKDLK